MPRYHPHMMNVGRRPEKRKEAPGGKENAEPNKKQSLSLRKGKDKGEPQQRFREITTDEQLAELSKGHVPKH